MPWSTPCPSRSSATDVTSALPARPSEAARARSPCSIATKVEWVSPPEPSSSWTRYICAAATLVRDCACTAGAAPPVSTCPVVAPGMKTWTRLVCWPSSTAAAWPLACLPNTARRPPPARPPRHPVVRPIQRSVALARSPQSVIRSNVALVRNLPKRPGPGLATDLSFAATGCLSECYRSKLIELSSNSKAPVPRPGPSSTSSSPSLARLPLAPSAERPRFCIARASPLLPGPRHPRRPPHRSEACQRSRRECSRN